MNTDKKLKEAVIKLFLDNLKLLATHPSQYGMPLVPVKKKDERTRWVTNLRELNKQTVKDSYSLTNIQEILHSLQGATVFASLDL